MGAGPNQHSRTTTVRDPAGALGTAGVAVTILLMNSQQITNVYGSALQCDLILSLLFQKLSGLYFYDIIRF